MQLHRCYERTSDGSFDREYLMLLVLVGVIVAHGLALPSSCPKGFFPQQDTGR